MSDDAHELIIRKLRDNPRLAHSILFSERHSNTIPSFHGELIDVFHGPDEQVVLEAFRGAGKSTLAEEGFIIEAANKRFMNGLIVGDSEPLAIERLQAIRHEIESNEALNEIYGDLRGSVWAERKITLSNGVALQARGTGQSLRGTKHLDHRPDFILLDDIENEESVANEGQLKKTLRWILKTLIPACDPRARIRFLGNRLDEKAVIVQLANTIDWAHRRIPIMYQDDNGDWQPSWPDRFPMEWINAKRDSYMRLGSLNEFNQEFMCEASSPEEKAFSADMIKVQPQVRVWDAVYCMIDPARTVRTTSARTGFSAWSYRNNKIIVWEAWGKLLKPDEIISSMFDADRVYQPVAIGFEGDGLNEWAAQPLRAEQIKRSISLPIREVYAPRDRSKDMFIKGLQPFFKAGEIIFAQELPDLAEQIKAFPGGYKDILNTLAYALRMKPGAPIYDEFRDENISEGLLLNPNRALYLVLNATASYVTGCLVQYNEGLRVLADFVEDAEPSLGASMVLRNASLQSSGMKMKIVSPPVHFDQYSNVGLRQAVAKIPADMLRGRDLIDGREEMRRLFRTQNKGLPGIVVAADARWSLNAFAGGYAREYGKRGTLADEAREGPYRTLMEGLESFAALLRSGAPDDMDSQLNYATTADGRQYHSARVTR